MTNNRREFLSKGLILTLGSLMPAGWLQPISNNWFNTAANAADSLKGGPDHFFVHILADGGWDVTLSLDPWLKPELPDENDMYIEYRPEDVLRVSDDLALAPAAQALVKHADDISVLNGLFMSSTTIDHASLGDYIARCSGSKLGGELVVELGEELGEGVLGVLHGRSIRTGTRTTATYSLNALPELSKGGDPSSVFAGQAHARSSFGRAAKRLVDSGPTVKRFVEAFEGTPPIEGEGLLSFHTMAAGFLSGGARFAQTSIFNPNVNFDTHAGHPQAHFRSQQVFWGLVSDLFDYFKAIPFGSGGESLFDRTTFLISSEFARTSALNGAKGKDHNPLTNSALLAGRGIAKGKMFGASRLVTRSQSANGLPYHIALPLDFAAGEVMRTRQPQAEMIFPENLGKTISKLFSESADFETWPEDIAPIPGIII